MIFNMKKQIFKGLFMITVLSVGMWACKKEVDNTTNTTTTDVTKEYKIKSPQEINEARIYFAKTLSKAIVNTELREYIHEKMKLRYTSQYEFVWIVEKDKKLKSGKTISSILSEYMDKTVIGKYGKNFFNDVVTIDPLIAISYPEREKVNIEKWNINEVPDVVSVMDMRDASKGEYFTFDSKGDEILAPRGNEPENPTLVVWEAERHYLINKNGMTTKGVHIRDFMPKVYQNGLSGRNDCDNIWSQAIQALNVYDTGGDYFYLVEHNRLLEEYYNCVNANNSNNNNNNNNGSTTNSQVPGCPRDNEFKDEQLAAFKINGYSVWDNIDGGFWETTFIFHADISVAFRNSLGTISSSPLKFVSLGFSKSDILDCSNSPCIGKLKGAFFRIGPDWDQAFMANPMTISWSEVDDGTTTIGLNGSLGVSFAATKTLPAVSSTLGISFSQTTAAIVQLGSQNVFYCDPLKQAYDTGSITFFMRDPTK
jgi:hypothetical protein